MAQKPAWQWTKEGGSLVSDEGLSCVNDYLGNVYVTGKFNGTASFGTNMLVSQGYGDMFLAKYNSSGNLLWVRQAGGAGDDSGNKIVVDSVGKNIYITGSFNQTATFDTAVVVSKGNQDVFIAKYDSSGRLKWIKHGGSVTAYSLGLSIALDVSQKNVYATGLIGISGMFDTIALSNPYSDIYIVKYDASNGNIKWAKKAGGPSDDAGNDIATDGDGSIYITGYTKSTATFDTIHINSTGGYHSIFLAKYDSSGKALWVRQAEGVGSSRDNDGGGVAVDKLTGNVFVTGDITGTAHFGTTLLTSNGSADIFLAQYNSSGTLQWVKKFGSTGFDMGQRIKIDNASNAFVSGSFNGTVSFVDSTITAYGGQDGFFAKFNSAGKLQWIEEVGGSGKDAGNDISIDANGQNIYVAGTFTGAGSFGSFNLNGYGNTDLFAGKLANSTVDCSDRGPNLILNSDFSLSNTGFSSDYTYTTTANGLHPEGTYAVGANALYYNVDALGNIYDHTVGNSSGKYLLANGAITAGKNIWCQTISVTPNSFYVFSGWMISWSSNTTSDFPVLQTSINGIALPNNDSCKAGGWQQFSKTWYSGSATIATICIQDLYTAVGGNDCGLDDFSFNLCGATSSIAEADRLNEIIIYPNPSNGIFTINFGESIRNGELIIYNSLGQSIIDRNLSSIAEILMNVIRPGIYFVNVRTANSQYTQKIIIQ